MHERALMNDADEQDRAEVARADGAARVTRVSVRLGALSHFTPEHFREHFVDASSGTIAEGAQVDAVLDDDIHAANAVRCRARDRRGGGSKPRGGALMCLGSIALLAAAWDDDGVPVGRLEDGTVVSLSFVPEAEPGATALHLGIPVEVLDAKVAGEALELRGAS